MRRTYARHVARLWITPFRKRHERLRSRPMAFVVGAYQAIEHPGAGHRAGRTSLWRGEDLRTGEEVAMTLLPADRADDARAAVAAVEVIAHPHLLPVIDVVAGEVTPDDERVAVVCLSPGAGRVAE